MKRITLLLFTFVIFNSCKKETIQNETLITNSLKINPNSLANTEQENSFLNLFSMFPEIQYQWDHPILTFPGTNEPLTVFVELYTVYGINEFLSTNMRFSIAGKDYIDHQNFGIEEGDVEVFSNFGSYYKLAYIIKGGGKNLTIQNGVYVGQKSSQFDIFLQLIQEFQAASEFFINYTQTSGLYSESDYELSKATSTNISVNVQAPFPPDTLHKVDITDSRHIQRPLSSFMFSFKYYRDHPTTISNFNFISASLGIDYTLAEPMSVSSIIHAQNTINIKLKIKQSITPDGFPISFIYWCTISYNYYSESAQVSYTRIM